MCNPFYNGILCTINLLALLISFYYDHTFEDKRIEQLNYWRASSICFNLVFLIDLSLNIGICKIKYIIKNRKHLLLEIALQLCSIATYVNLFSKDKIEDFATGVGFCMAIYMLRLLRIIEYFVELQQFAVIIETGSKFILPSLATTINLYTLFYSYAYFGEFLWGGEITTHSAQVSDPDIPDLYYLMNFNDFGSSVITLFHIMVVNNWFITCNMFITVTGNRAIPEIFFISFWILTVLIIFNLVISNVIEIYISVESTEETKFKRLKQANKLKG